MVFNKAEALKQAASLAKGFNPQKAKRFAEKNSDKSWYSNFKLLYDMITDHNFKLDYSVYLSIAGALAYVIMPIDVIPDFLPGIGYIDDVFVVGMVMKSLANDIERFKLTR